MSWELDFTVLKVCRHRLLFLLSNRNVISARTQESKELELTHLLLDFYAHSNYCELALIELGERDIFPHCGRDTQIDLEGARGSVYPIVTGTFGGVDFLHSVTGEGRFLT